MEAPPSPQVAIFGVPRRNVPGAPRMLLRKPPAPQSGIQIIALPVESGAVPAGYRVFRVQNPSLSLDASTMGPPKIDETDAAWRDSSGTTLTGNLLAGKTVIDSAATASWYPYYYRITAIGVEDPANGLLSGESAYSGAQSEYALPPNPPMLAGFTMSGTPLFALVNLLTDLPITPSPLGPALVEVVQMIPDPGRPGRLVAQRILSTAPDQIPIGTIAPPPITPPPHPPFPPVPPKPTRRLARSAPDASGRWTLHILVPHTAAQKNTFAVRLTDPLARQSSRSF